MGIRIDTHQTTAPCVHQYADDSIVSVPVEQKLVTTETSHEACLDKLLPSCSNKNSPVYDCAGGQTPHTPVSNM